MQCDMCGKEESSLLKTLVEGTEMNLCRDCSKYGEVRGVVKEEVPEKKKKEAVEEPEEEVVEVISEEFSSKLKNKRESMGMKQEEFAKSINEKESVVHKWETGEMTPNIGKARELEKKLKLKIVEEIVEKHERNAPGKAEAVTIGDIIKVRKKN
ncbi:TIGR00270 family protein [Candidatus Woesearchaeota archaeon]|nr:TIGR00270 family protein [Candidatus Woesearchaeota archaeon]